MLKKRIHFYKGRRWGQGVGTVQDMVGSFGENWGHEGREAKAAMSQLRK